MALSEAFKAIYDLLLNLRKLKVFRFKFFRLSEEKPEIQQDFDYRMRQVLKAVRSSMTFEVNAYSWGS